MGVHAAKTSTAKWRAWVVNQLAAAEAFKVGGVYINTTGTNPATELGYGTWTQTARGRTILGEGTSDVAYTTGGATGGASTHTLTLSEIPSHDHGGGNHSHSGNPSARDNGNFGARWGATSRANQGNKTTTSSGTIINSEGSDGAHNNMPPYLVVYVWERTA